ncbi:MAG: hypothetical protein Q9212_005948 [Teloschistes hypoglaucus]
MPALRLLEVKSDEEFTELIECEWLSYEQPYNGFFQLYCPTTGTGPNARAESMRESTDRQLAWHREDPTSSWLKVVDDDHSGKVVGAAQWNIHHSNPYPNGVEENDAFWWPEGEERRFASKALEQWHRPREARMSKPHVLLNICFVLPEYRRCGAGSMMVKWGVQKADELKLETFIEAAEPGIPLYLKQGFELVDYHVIDPTVEDPSERWKELKERLPPVRWAFMRRSATGVAKGD